MTISNPLALKSFLDRLAAALDEDSKLKLQKLNDDYRNRLNAVQEGRLANSYQICWLSSCNEPCVANINVWD